MAVTDQHVTALRTYLVGDADDWERLHRDLIESGDVAGYGEFVYAAFVAAVRQRFSPTWTKGDVIQFVAGIRAALSEDPNAIDPRAAEHLIRRALNDPVTDEIDAETKARAEVLLLAALIEDEQLDDSALEEFLSRARALAGRWWPSASHERSADRNAE